MNWHNRANTWLREDIEDGLDEVANDNVEEWRPWDYFPHNDCEMCGTEVDEDFQVPGVTLVRYTGPKLYVVRVRRTTGGTVLVESFGA